MTYCDPGKTSHANGVDDQGDADGNGDGAHEDLEAFGVCFLL
jgi:hypothetical protein